MSQANWDHIERYKQSIIQGDTIADIWGTDDVREMFGQLMDTDNPPKYLLGKELTDDDARSILCMVSEYFDAEIGINWDQIEAQIDSHFERDE
jgi:hypothetical protein